MGESNDSDGDKGRDEAVDESDGRLGRFAGLGQRGGGLLSSEFQQGKGRQGYSNSGESVTTSLAASTDVRRGRLSRR